MKRAISFLLAIIMIASAVFYAPVLAGALTAPSIDAKANGTKYSVWWKYNVSGVTKFNVYVDGKYDGYKNVNSSKSYSYTTDPYKTGMKHSIQIKAIKGKTTISSNKINRVLAPSVVKIKTSANESGYTLTASCDGKFDGVSLYKYNSNKGKYEFYKNFTKSITIKSTTKTTYKAKAYVKYPTKTYYGQYCSAFSCCAQLGAVTLSSAKSDSVGKITLNWVKPKYSFTGYQIIYTSYDDFSTSHTVKVAPSAVKTTLNLEEGVCYKVCVRTYKTTNSVTINGKWSSQKTLYTKSGVGETADAKTLLNKTLKLSGAYSTKCEKLNNALDKILDKLKCGKNSTYANYDKIRFVYTYIATEQFKKDGVLGAKGSEKYSYYTEYAVLSMLKNKGGGSCYEYNYLFMYLCKRMGVSSVYMVNGSVTSSGSGRTGHYWNMIKIGSHNYYFDPRMQKYTSNTKAYTFFCLPMNGNNKYSDYYRFMDASEQLL